MFFLIQVYHAKILVDHLKKKKKIQLYWNNCKLLAEHQYF